MRPYRISGKCRYEAFDFRDRSAFIFSASHIQVARDTCITSLFVVALLVTFRNLISAKVSMCDRVYNKRL
jgi:hypothetical protein